MTFQDLRARQAALLAERSYAVARAAALFTPPRPEESEDVLAAVPAELVIGKTTRRLPGRRTRRRFSLRLLSRQTMGKKSEDGF